MYKKLILGSPGTGKTTRLLDILENKLKTYSPERIAFFSFTKKAVQEATDRAMAKFQFDKKRFIYFRTIHSMTFRELNINTKNVRNNSTHLRRLEEITGLRFGGKNLQEDDSLEKGDKFLFLESYARSTKQSLRDVWAEGIIDVYWEELKQFAETYEEFKKEEQLIDFTDMLVNYDKGGSALDIDIAIIDEAQDLNALQWDVVIRAIANAKEVYIAGDDDQAIYKWSGADVEQFLGLAVNEKEILPLSYRLPKRVYNLANTIVKKIIHRYEKNWASQEKDGNIFYHNQLSSIKFEGNWLVLTRTNRQLRRLEEFFRENGYFYQSKKHCVKEDHLQLIQAYLTGQRKGEISSVIKKWFDKDKAWYEALEIISFADREYYRNLLRQGFKLNETPKILLNTIHGSKGGESDNVLITLDLPKQTYDLYAKSPDDEHRVFYVAVTRAKQNLHILTPQTDLYYDF